MNSLVLVETLVTQYTSSYSAVSIFFFVFHLLIFHDFLLFSSFIYNMGAIDGYRPLCGVLCICTDINK